MKNISQKKKWAGVILRQLTKHYPDAACGLQFKNPFQLIVATILSAQCTDQRVNLVTASLFKKFPTAKKMAAADLVTIEKIIKSSGLFRNKAKSIKNCSLALIDHDHGQVPQQMKELIKLPGVGRKTANVVLGNAFNLAAGIAVDTHVARLSFRLGLTTKKDPQKIEPELLLLFPQKSWVFINHALIAHGREICRARNANCQGCFLNKKCPRQGLK